MSDKTHISMIIDRSGSMQDCAAETIGAVNGYLASAREDAALKEADLQLTIFDSQSIDTIRSGQPVALADITAQDFVPRGMTPLYDAIGRGIDSLDKRVAEDGSSKAILVIVTDGAENSSHKYRDEEGRQLIQSMLTERQGKGWLVIFLGAGLDAAQQGAKLGVRLGSTANIAKDDAALRAMSKSVYSMNAAYAASASPMEFMETADAQFSAKARADMGDASDGAGLAPPTIGQPDPADPTDPTTFLTRKPSTDSLSKTPGDAWGN